MVASLIEAPAQWYVRAVSHVPDPLRPGLFLAGGLALGWFVLRQGGIAIVWHALVRGFAVVIQLVIAAVLVPEYLATTRRRRQDRPPASLAVAVGDVADVLLDGADTLHGRNPPEPVAWKTFPWRLSLLLIALGAGAWLAMEHVPDGGASRVLSQSFDVWRDAEAWADVSPDRRAEPGPASDAAVVLPATGGITRNGRKVTVRFYCGDQHRCAATAVIVTGRGRSLTSRPVWMAPSTTRVFHFPLRATAARYAKHVAVVVEATRAPGH